MSKKEKGLRLQRLLKYQEQTVARTLYAIQRFDLLIISISGAGIYLVFETLKFLKTPTVNMNPINIPLVKFSGLVFTVAIIVNFMSQLAGWLTNTNEDKWTNLEIKKENGEKYYECELEELDKKIIRNNWWTAVLNWVSALFMFAGIILAIIFYWQNF